MINNNIFGDPDYDTQNLFNESVANLVTNYTSGTGTVKSITVGNGLSASPADITVNGIISLKASLNDLEDVNLTTPTLNQVLSYNGTSWVSSTLPGVSPVTFLSLTDTPNSFAGFDNYLLEVNNNNIVFKENTSIENIVAGEGINVINDTNSARIELNTNSLLENFSSNNTDQYIIRDSNNNMKRIQQNNINISGFNNDSSFITNNNLIEGNYITITTVGSNSTISVDTNTLPGADFNNGVSGILDVVNGGTQSGTSSGARNNLGLEYNVDILTQSGPSFDDTMFGDNILLQPSYFSLSVGTSIGTAPYIDGVATLTSGTFDNIPVEITVNGSGHITAVTSNSGTSFTGRGNYNDQVSFWDVEQGAVTGGTVEVTPEIQYINFGNTTGPNGKGMRNNKGTLEIKETDSSTWQTVFPMTISKIDDLVDNGANNGDVFIYNGTSWENQALSGFINVDASGNTTYAGGNEGIAITAVEGGANLVADDVASLFQIDTVKGTIQEQLDNKVGTSEISPLLGDIIYYNNTAPTFWEPLHIGASRQIINSGDGTSIPQYDYLRDILDYQTGSTYTAGDYIIPVMANSGSDLSINASVMFDTFSSGTSSGIELNNDLNLSLNASKLQTNNSLDTSQDYLIYYDNASSSTKNILTSDFCNSIAGLNLTGSANKIALAEPLVQPVVLPTYTVLTSPAGVSGSMAYFTDGDSGNPCLAVHNGADWKRIPLGATIST